MSSKIQWSDIDKPRFYGIGTGMYTAITMTLHPINVVKTRKQVLTECVKSADAKILSQARGLYRGLGIILVMAVPARGVYIGTLENSRDVIYKHLCDISFFQKISVDALEETRSPLATSISGGLAGGIASMVAQTLVVPMDVISQRQMVMDNVLYTQRGSAITIMSDILKTDGWRGMYRGFGMSLFTSLPVGFLWWSCYSGTQHLMHRHGFVGHSNDFKGLAVKGFGQLTCGLSAAFVAATLSQPFDVIKTRVQVQVESSSPEPLTINMRSNLTQAHRQITYTSVARDLYITYGIRGFFRGTGPRLISMGLWGTVLSSAYEYLRHVSSKDYEFNNIFDSG